MRSELRSIRPELAEITLCPDPAVLVNINISQRGSCYPDLYF